MEQQRRVEAQVAANARRAASLAANVAAVRAARANAEARAARAASHAANVSPRAAKIAEKQARPRPTRSHKKNNSRSRKMTKKHFSAHPHRFTRIPISTRRNRQ